jgi:hypothetical protein
MLAGEASPNGEELPYLLHCGVLQVIEDNHVHLVAFALNEKRRNMTSVLQ